MKKLFFFLSAVFVLVFSTSATASGTGLSGPTGMGACTSNFTRVAPHHCVSTCAIGSGCSSGGNLRVTVTPDGTCRLADAISSGLTNAKAVEVYGHIVPVSASGVAYRSANAAFYQITDTTCTNSSYVSYNGGVLEQVATAPTALAYLPFRITVRSNSAGQFYYNFTGNSGTAYNVYIYGYYD